MADSQFYTNEAALTKAGVIKTSLAAGKLRLFQSSFVPSRFSTKADLVAAEATFDGYPAGGYPCLAWNGPLLPDGGGASLTSVLFNIAYGPAADPPTGNQLGGWWYEDATGKVWLVGTWAPARPMNMIGQGFPFVIQDIEGRTITVQPAEQNP